MGQQSVVVVGGGVAGMSAAHELAERGFDVSVYERRDLPGGKARSIDVPNSAPPGRLPLEGEHGFRFFGGFYRHLIDTMERIPYRDQRGGVAANLVETSRAEFAQAGKPSIVLPDRFPRSLSDLNACGGFLDAARVGISASEAAYFVGRLLMLLASCDERRYSEWEHLDWWTFVGAAGRSRAYQQFLADGMTRRFVAAQAREISTRTCGYILLQLMFEFSPGRQMDRVLNGPTNDVWIDPWLEYLRARGVRYELNADVQAINCAGGRVTSVTVSRNGVAENVVADHYVAAVPLEIMRTLATDALRELEPSLTGLDGLRTRWMNGIQFFLERDLPICHGHTIYLDSAFGLTSVSQRQFWADVDFSAMGDGGVGGILSVDISDWETPGILYGKPAMELTAEEVKDEVWAQLSAHLRHRGGCLLDDVKPLGWFLDPDIVWPNPRTTMNLEPLLINTVGSWDLRPAAVTAIDNLFLAGDYVRTYTDLATMEGANEAARRAVNGILDAAGSNAERCGVWPLREPAVFAPLRWLDRQRFRQGLPAELPMKRT